MPDITDIERLNYYEGEYLGAVDFQAEQEYHRDMRRRHNIGPHTWGIVTGLDIAQFLNGGPNNEVDVFIQPGVAVDGFGREIVVLSPFQLTPDQFVDFPARQLLPVWIGYMQQLLQPAKDQCSSANQANAYSRVQESFQIVIEPIPPTSDPTLVAGNQVAPPSPLGWTQPGFQPTLPTNVGDVVLAFDDSVPFQELPDSNTVANWLVPLGQVLWDGPNQRFLQTSPPLANKGRLYTGTVTSTIYAPAGSLVIQDRSTPSSFPAGATGVAVEVQGTLTVDRQLTAQADVWIEGELFFKDAGGADGDTVLGVQRIDGSAGGADLHIHIGDNTDPVNKPQRLTVGYGQKGSTNPDTNVFTVASNGNVTMPSGSLSFGTQLAQTINLWSNHYGIGVQPSTLFFRSDSDFAFYVGGTYSNKKDDPGGGSPSLLLDSSGSMTLNGALAINNANTNNGSINPGLTFGAVSGEGIASKRTAGGNQYGLDFYTGFALRMSLTQGGNLGIGTPAPDAPLNVGGGNWDVGATEGDFKIGNDVFRLKMGVALGGGGAGDVRIRAQGGTSRLMLGSGTADILTIAGGNVGINTTTPGAALDVVGSGNFTGGLSANMLSLSGGISMSGGIAMGGGIAAGAGIACSNIATSGSVNIGAGLLVHGNLSVNGSKSGYVADRIISHADRPLEKGDVVVLFPTKKVHYYGTHDQIPLLDVSLTTIAGDSRVCGIIDEPTVPQEELGTLDAKALGLPAIGLMVTLGAYAHCKVDAGVAPISAGDLLTTSKTPGYAQRFVAEYGSPTGAILGKALASLEHGKGIIPVLVSHQ